MAIRADVLARNVEPHHAAANGRPERHVHLVFKVGARFGSSLRRRCTAPAAEDSREDVLESTTAAPPPPPPQKFPKKMPLNPPPPPLRRPRPALSARSEKSNPPKSK